MHFFGANSGTVRKSVGVRVARAWVHMGLVCGQSDSQHFVLVFGRVTTYAMLVSRLSGNVTSTTPTPCSGSQEEFMSQSNGSDGKQRRQFTPEEKATIDEAMMARFPFPWSSKYVSQTTRGRVEQLRA